jgi:D-glycero-beta-D-manno-heptose-7-phosphate kinase
MQKEFSEHTINTLKYDLVQAKVLVVGDVMLDRYWFSDVDRISPEAPVPVAKIVRTENRPGGAANVARNISSLGGQVTLLSVIGEDEAGRDLEQILTTDKVTTLLRKDTTISTTVKLRVVARNQQLIRLDFEQHPSHEILNEVLGEYESLIDSHDVVILSDYGKGGLSHTKTMIDLARQHNKQILVDPKGSDYSRYQNATIITPNRSELRDAVGQWGNEEQLTNKVQQLMKELNLEYLLLTRSEEGMSLFVKDDRLNIHYPTLAHEVYDVSGAGDTVIAVLSLMLAGNIPIDEAAHLANIAAGIVVGKLGTATVTQSELLKQL